MFFWITHYRMCINTVLQYSPRIRVLNHLNTLYGFMSFNLFVALCCNKLPFLVHAQTGFIIHKNLRKESVKGDGIPSIFPSLRITQAAWFQ